MHPLCRCISYGFLGLCLCGASLCGCSGGPKAVVEQRAAMATDYPRTGVDTLRRLARVVPGDAHLVVSSSYGSLVEAVQAFAGYAWVPEKDLQSTLTDLGTHYRLNPSRLSDYYKAGFETRSGFAAGLHRDALFVVFDIDEADLFSRWLDNFIQEEFGRPTYTESREGARRFVHIAVLGPDFATYVIEAGAPAIVMFGAGLSESLVKAQDSRASLDAFLAAPAMDSSSLDAWPRALADAPVVVLVNGENAGKNAPLPESWRGLTTWFSQATVGLHLSPDALSLALYGQWQKDEYRQEPRGPWAAELGRGDSRDWPAAILATQPASTLRLVVGAHHAETLAVEYMSDKTAKKYRDLKGKLTQSLIKLDVSKQIIDNIGAIWGMHYGEGAAVAGVVFKDAAQSDAFFSKLNILKRVVPADVATIDTVDGMLQATIHVSSETFRAGYRDGFLALATTPGWPKAEAVFAGHVPGQASAVPIAQNAPFLAGEVRTADIASTVNIPAVQKILAPFSRFRVDSSLDERAVSLSLSLSK